MNPGLFRHRVTIQQRSTAQDESGQQSGAWRTLMADLPAEIDTLSVREVVAAQANNIEATHRISVRWLRELDDPVAVGALRVLFRGRVMDIKSAVNVDERDREIRMLASQGLTQG